MMKGIIALLCFSLFLTTASRAQDTEVTSTVKGTVYGVAFQEQTPLKGTQIHKKLKKKGKKVPMQIQGKVESVCAKKGCWMNVKVDDNTSLFIKMKDYAFFVPKTGLEGKTVLLQGEGYKEILSVDEQKHYAQDAGKSKEEVDAITTEQENLRFTATGIKVMD